MNKKHLPLRLKLSCCSVRLQPKQCAHREESREKDSLETNGKLPTCNSIPFSLMFPWHRHLVNTVSHAFNMKSKYKFAVGN